MLYFKPYHTQCNPEVQTPVNTGEKTTEQEGFEYVTWLRNDFVQRGQHTNNKTYKEIHRHKPLYEH